MLSLYQGCARSIIVAERVVLNFMQRMSGIATLTKVIPALIYMIKLFL
jgi:nicotinate-nucleotide pyrophosphorylase